MKKRDNKGTHSVRTKVMTWVLTLVMLLGLIPVGAFHVAEAAEKEMWEIALENDYLSYTTVNACGGTGHLQGICVDDKMEYMYFSYTDLLAKVDMKTGEVVGSIGGFGEGGYGTAGGAHLGCLSYHDGMIYGSLEYKTPGKKFFVCAFDEDVITTTGMDIKDLSSGVYGILLREPTEDFRNPLNDTPEADGFAANGGVLGHAFGCSGIDGITFGTLPGDTSGKVYMMVAYGVYGQGSTSGWDNRYDNNYNVIQCYDPADFELGDSAMRRFTYARGIDNTVDVDGGEYLEAAETLYVWTGNTDYGVQNLEYDKATGDILLYTYGATKSWGSGALFVVDGSVAPVEKELELGQSNTAADAAVQAAAKEKAKSYMVDTDSDGVADAYPTGKHAALKCVCGAADHAAAVCGDTGVTAKICGTSSPATAVCGAVSLGGNYFYLTSGDYSATLYQRTANHSYSKAAGRVEKQQLVHLSMDTADLYERDGVVYMKNSADPTGANDAIVEGTTSGKGVQGGDGSALAFDAWQYPNRVDQVYLSQDTIAMINEKVENAKGHGTFSYSFWYKTPASTATDGNFLPVIGFFREDNTYANIIQHRWRNALGSCTNGIGSATVGSTATAVPNPNKVDPGDSNFYIYKGVDKAWHHIAVTEAAGAIKVYVDGSLYNSRNVSATHLQAEPFAEFIIGGGKGKVWQDMNNRGRVIGEIDDVQIWSGALTADEVKAMYDAKPANAATNPAHPGLVEATPNKTYAAYDLTDDAGKDLTVDAGMAVTSITGLTKDADYTVSGNNVTLKASWLAAQTCGIVTLQLDGSAPLDVTITDREVPVLNFKLDKSGVSGNVVEDSSVYGKNATTTDSITFTADQAGVVNGAMVFDGYNYQYPTYVKLDETNADWLNSVLKKGYTLNFWANANAENGTRMAFGGLFAENARPLGAIETNDGDNNNKNIDGKLKVQVNVGKTAANSAQEIKPSATVATTKAWTMYTATYDKATNTVKLYVNKAEVASGTVEDNIIGAIDQLFIGHQYGKYYSQGGDRDWTTRGGFRGAISDFSVYNYALDTTAITELYDEGLEVTFADINPVINWSMDADSLNGDGTISESSSDLLSYYQNVKPVKGVDGKEGGALYFTGNADSGDYSRVWLSDEGVAALNDSIGSSMTVAFWMQPDHTANSEKVPFTGQWTPVGGVFGESDNRFLMVAEYRGNNLHYCAQSGGDKRVISSYGTSNGNWYYVVMTFDGATTETAGGTTSNVRRIYIADSNGNILAEPKPDRGFTSTTLFNKITHVEFGGQYAKGHWTDTNVRGRYIGAIDDISIYNVPMTRDDVIAMAKAKTVTGNGVSLSAYDYEVGVAAKQDVTVTTANAGALQSVSGLSASQYSVSGTAVTLDGDALAAMGVGEHQLTLTFANGEKVINVTVKDDREFFTGDVKVFNKTAPTDVTVTAADSFGAVTAVSATDLTAEDYTVSGKSITLKKEWLLQQQPGAVELTVTAAGGTQTALVYVISPAPTATQPAGEMPFPVLHYEMDLGDLSTVTDANGTVRGTLQDKSGSGMTLQVGGLTKASADSASAANGAIFFDGYRDFDISRAWLDENGVDYLNAVLGDEIAISFWHKGDRITSNYMPVLGLFAENDRPLLLAEFRDGTGSERAGVGESTKPTLTATASGSKSIDSGVLSAADVKMDSTWHHYVLTYNNTTGAAVLYVDGAAGKTGTVSAGQISDIAKFEIGGLTNAEYFDITNYYSTKNHGRLYGNLDDVKVYNVALDATQVAALYAEGVDEPKPIDLTGYSVGVTDAKGEAMVKDNAGSGYRVYVSSFGAAVEGATLTVSDGKLTVTLPAGESAYTNTKVIVTDSNGNVAAGLPVVVTDSAVNRRFGKTTDGAGAVEYLAQFQPGDYSVTDNAAATYNTAAQASATVTNAVGATITYTCGGQTYTTVPAFTDVGTYAVAYTVTKTGYESEEGSYSFTVKKAPAADLQVNAVGIDTAFDGTAKSVSVTAISGATIEYSTDGGQTWTTTAPSFNTVISTTVDYRVSKANYETATGTVSVKIVNGTITGYGVTANPAAKYDGTAKVSGTVAAGTPDGVTITYTCGGQTYTEIPSFTAVGSYKVDYTVAKSGYNTVSGSYTFVIEKGDLTGYKVEANAAAKYDGAAKVSGKVTEGTPAGAAITYTCGGQDYNTVPSFTEVGSYEVSYTVKKDGYNDVTGKYTFVIEKGDLTGYKVEANAAVKYDGTAKVSGKVTEGTPAGATITYTCGGQTYNTVPSFTDVGSYVVSYTVSKDGYNDVTGSYTFVIEKGDITGFVITANDTVPYDAVPKTSATVTVGSPADATITYTWDNGNESGNEVPKFTAVGSYTVTYIISKPGYNNVTGSYTFTIEKGQLSQHGIAAADTVKYDGTAKVSAVTDAAILGDAVVSYTCGEHIYTDVPAFTEPGTYTVSYTIKKTGYEDVTGSYTFTIEKGDLTGYKVEGNTAVKYDEQAHASAVFTEGTPAGAMVTYVCGSNTYSAVPQFTAVGSYKVTYTVSKHGYNDVTGEYTFVINKGDIAGFAIEANDTAKYDGTAKASAEVTVGVPADAKITYTCGNDTYNAVPEFTDVGTYKVSYTVSKDGYNDVTGEYSFTIEKGDLSGYKVEGNAAVKYDEQAHASAVYTEGTPVGATVTYTCGSDTYNAVPQFTAVGSYTVGYTISKYGYNDVTGEYTFVINKGDIVGYSVTANAAVKYDGNAKVSATVDPGKPADAAITYVCGGKTYNEVPSFTEAGTYAVSYTISKEGYNDVTGSYSFTVDKADITGYSVTANAAAKYNGETKTSATVVSGLPIDASITYKWTEGGVEKTSTTVPGFVLPGTYTVSYTIGKANYNDITGSYVFTVNNGDITGYSVTANGTAKYNGETKTSAAVVSGIPADAVITYKWTEGGVEKTSTTVPGFSAVGEYDVSYTITRQYYNDVTGSYTFKIEKGDLADYGVAANDAAKYDGTPKASATVTAGVPADAVITFTWTEGQDEKTSTTAPSFTLPGVYTVDYVINRDSYNDVKGTYTFKIEKGDLTGFAVTGNDNAKYDGTEKVSATVTTGVPADAKITYTCGNDTFDAVPKFTEVGTYDVSYTVSKEHYNDATGRYRFVIEKGDLTGYKVEGKDAVKYNGEAHKSADYTEGTPAGAKITYTCGNDTFSAVPEFTAVGTYTVSYTITKDSYNDVTGSYTFKVEKGDITGYEIKANDTVKYDGAAKVSATVAAGIPADAKITYTCGSDTFNAVPEFTAVGVYTVSYTISRDSYNDVTGQYTFEIVKGDITGYEIKANDAVKYDGTAKVSAVVTTGVPADAKITYTCGTDTFTEVPSFTEVGTYEVSYTVSKDGYNDVTGSYTFIIEKGDLTGYKVEANETVKYDEQAHSSAVFTEGTPAGATVTYTCGTETFTEVPSFTEVGTYEVSYTVSKHGYNDVTGSYTFEIVKGDITGFEIEANEPVVYDGEAHESATVTAGIPADATVTYTCGSDTFSEVPAFTEAGVYEVSYVVSKAGYNDVTGSYVFTVDVAQWDDGIKLAGKAEYTGEPIAVADVSKLPEGAIFRFVLANEKGEFTEEGLFEIGKVPAFTEVGKYKLAYASYLDDNHEEHYGEFVFEIVEPAPETGDTFQLGLWLAVAALTAAAGIVLVLRRKEQA